MRNMKRRNCPLKERLGAVRKERHQQGPRRHSKIWARASKSCWCWLQAWHWPSFHLVIQGIGYNSDRSQGSWYTPTFTTRNQLFHHVHRIPSNQLWSVVNAMSFCVYCTHPGYTDSDGQIIYRGTYTFHEDLQVPWYQNDSEDGVVGCKAFTGVGFHIDHLFKASG